MTWDGGAGGVRVPAGGSGRRGTDAAGASRLSSCPGGARTARPGRCRARGGRARFHIRRSLRPAGRCRPAGPGRPRAVRGASPVVTAGRSGADGRLRPRPALMARGRPGTVPRTRDSYPHHPRGPPRGRRGRPVRRDRPCSGPVSCPTTAPGPRGGTREPEGSTSAARSAGPASRSGRRPSARDPATRPGSPAGVVLTRRCPRPGGAGVRG